MSLSLSSLCTLFLAFSLLFPSVTSFDINQILSHYPSFSTFSNYLAQTQLASQINSRQTITVLAVDNSGLSSVSGKPMDVIKKVLSIHVILDYFDPQKLQHLNFSSGVTITTLLQASGQATGQQGFLTITNSTGTVSFASAADQNGARSNLIKSVVSQPYNLSVLQVSSVIVPSDNLGSTANSSSSNSPTTSPASPSPTPSKNSSMPVPFPGRGASPPAVNDTGVDSPPSSGPAPDASDETLPAAAPGSEATAPAAEAESKSSGVSIREFGVNSALATIITSLAMLSAFHMIMTP